MSKRKKTDLKQNNPKKRRRITNSESDDDDEKEEELKNIYEISEKIILTYSNKGGTGKTSTTYQILRNLIISNENVKILIIDNDQQENLTSMFLPPILSRSLKGKDIAQSTVKSLLNTKSSPIKIDNNIDFLFFEFLDPTSDSSIHSPAVKEVISKSLNELSKKYDYVFIDCNPAHLPLTIHLIENVKKMIYLMDLSEFSKDGFITTMRLRKLKPLVILNNIDIQKVPGSMETYKVTIEESLKSTYKLINEVYKCPHIILPMVSEFNKFMTERKIVKKDTKTIIMKQDKDTYGRTQYHSRILEVIKSINENKIFMELEQPKPNFIKEIFDEKTIYIGNYFYIYPTDDHIIFGRSEKLHTRFTKKELLKIDSSKIICWKCDSNFETFIKHHFKHLRDGNQESIRIFDKRAKKMIINSICEFAKIY